MAAELYGRVYYQDDYAGRLQQAPEGRCTFTYDPAYLTAKHPALSFTLPPQAAPHISEPGLHPFFDNLVAEGWLRNAQARALRVDPGNRFALLLAFGRDCAGAVSVIDPDPVAEPSLDLGDPATAAALASRASLSGIQPKILAFKDDNRIRPARRNETSTHIAKLPSGSLRDIIENEFITTAATRALLPEDEIVDVAIGTVEGVEGRALIVERFDRRRGTKRHFEEFSQLFGRRSGDSKYDASYEDMAKFILTTPGCAPADALKLYRRILVCILTGNTDAHLKNFAMFHARDGMRLTPAYDLVSATHYPEFQTFALRIGNADLRLADIEAKHLISLGEAHRLNATLINDTIQRLDHRREAAEKAVRTAAKKAEATALGDSLLELMERRWNGSFASTGQFLSKKQSGDAKK
jgi:serine/threonine-protein kinase HipA